MSVEQKNIVFYTDADFNLEVRLKNDSLWLNQSQISELFDTDRTSITKHIHNIYDSEELQQKSTCAKIAQVQTEGNRQKS